MGRVRPSPTLSAVCTSLYLAQCVWAVYVVCDQHVGQLHAWKAFPLAMVGVMLLLNASKFMGKRIAQACGANKTNARKFGDQMWQLVIHASMTCTEIYVLADETWYSEPATSFASHVRGITPPTKTSVQLLYVTQLSIWIITCFSHHFLEARHKDYILMYVHHLVTIALILMSWSFGFQQIGTAVLYVHDASDITIDLLKMGNYLKLEGPSKLFAVEIVFVLNLVSWAWWRIYQLPFRIVRACIFDGFIAFYDDICRPKPILVTCSCYAFIWLLLALCLMHVWWLYLLLRIAYKLVAAPGKGHDAGRDEYEGDSDDGSDKDD